MIIVTWQQLSIARRIVVQSSKHTPVLEVQDVPD